jgi:glycerol-3-phosphate dehydrogenase
MNTTYDIAIIGGGINGCGIARDAAGRGLKVFLAEQDDLASATSSWSTKLIHGGLRYLEQYEFRLVRESLKEREVLLRLAPHIIHPLAFVLPHESHMRPALMIRAGLFLYDHLGGKISLPRSFSVNFPHTELSAGLRPSIKKGFVYSDARVDDARLTVLNAMSARAHGATIVTRTKVVGGRRENGLWHISLRGSVNHTTAEISAKAVVNAAGPWVKDVLDAGLHIDTTASVKLVKGSHIIVPRVHEEDHAYILQNDDGRIVFVIPYEGKFSLIGTTDVAVSSVDEGHAISEAEISYLLRAVNRYMHKSIHPRDVVHSYAGVRPLYDDGESNPSDITRDYVLKVNDDNGALPLLSIFGGKITTYRRLAEHALDELRPYFPQHIDSWTASEVLPGGEFADGDSPRLFAKSLMTKHIGVPPDFIERLVLRHGMNASVVLNRVRGMDDLGALFGRGLNLLCEREIEYLIAKEWARSAEDILWRRTKCGLHMDEDERLRAAEFIDGKLKVLI